MHLQQHPFYTKVTNWQLYIGMVLLWSYVSSSVDSWFQNLCNIFSCGGPIVMNFLYDFSNHLTKVPIQFGVCGPYHLGQKRIKIGVDTCRMFVFSPILIIPFLLTWPKGHVSYCHHYMSVVCRYRLLTSCPLKLLGRM